MTYNEEPNGLGIQCACCGNKPTDSYDPSPEGFKYVLYDGTGQWECDECDEKELTYSDELFLEGKGEK